jgi:hypothetical protein
VNIMWNYNILTIEKVKMVLPVCLARLSDVGLKKRSNCIADERMQRFIRRVLTKSEDSELRRHRFICINYRGTFNECQAKKKAKEEIITVSFLVSLNNCSLCTAHTN